MVRRRRLQGRPTLKIRRDSNVRHNNTPLVNVGS
jgi:hypothetical protein